MSRLQPTPNRSCDTENPYEYVAPCNDGLNRIASTCGISILLQAAGSRAGRLGPAGTTRGPGRTVRLPKVRPALRPNFRMYSHRRLRSAAGRAPMKSPSGLAGPLLVTHHGSDEQISRGLESALYSRLHCFTPPRSKEVLPTKQLSSGRTASGIAQKMRKARLSRMRLPSRQRT